MIEMFRFALLLVLGAALFAGAIGVVQSETVVARVVWLGVVLTAVVQVGLAFVLIAIHDQLDAIRQQGERAR